MRCTSSSHARVHFIFAFLSVTPIWAAADTPLECPAKARTIKTPATLYCVCPASDVCLGAQCRTGNHKGVRPPTSPRPENPRLSLQTLYLSLFFWTTWCLLAVYCTGDVVRVVLMPHVTNRCASFCVQRLLIFSIFFLLLGGHARIPCCVHRVQVRVGGRRTNNNQSTSSNQETDDWYVTCAGIQFKLCHSRHPPPLFWILPPSPRCRSHKYCTHYVNTC